MNRNGVAWGLISDVHGNLRALEAGVHVLRAAGAERFAFLGDYLGKGDSDGCVRLIRATADAAIVGNRDFDWQDRVSAESKAWVLSLPRTVTLGPLLLSHGDARLTPSLSTAEINRGFARARRELDLRAATVWAFGHSHFARTWVTEASYPRLLEAKDVAMEDGAQYFVNVGTAGLPFPGKGGPSVALVDLKHARIQHLDLESGLR